MKRLGICLLTLGWLLLLVSPVIAQQLVEGVVTGCKAELEKYCSNVTPGEGRVLACLYAHNDKLSGRCEYALYDAAVQLERAVFPMKEWGASKKESLSFRISADNQ